MHGQCAVNRDQFIIAFLCHIPGDRECIIAVSHFGLAARIIHRDGFPVSQAHNLALMFDQRLAVIVLFSAQRGNGQLGRGHGHCVIDIVDDLVLGRAARESAAAEQRIDARIAGRKAAHSQFEGIPRKQLKDRLASA